MSDSAESALVLALGTNVRRRRTDRGLTLAALAKGSGLSRRFLADVESGRANISVMNLARLARALGTSAGAMLEEPQVPTIALLGLRGAGKSTVGAALARRLGVPFVELDLLVEEQAGLPLAEVFAVHGESWYRAAEMRALEDVLAKGRPAVIATGGGIVTSRDALDLLRSRCLTVWLRARPEDHMQRVVQQGDLRPMAARGNAMTQLRQLLASRVPLYSEAELVVDTSDVDAPEVVDRIEEALSDVGK